MNIAFVENVRGYAIFTLCPDGYIEFWNAGAESLFGYSASEIVGKHFACLYPAVAVAGGKPQQELQVAAVAGVCEDEGWRYAKSGSQVWTTATLTAIRDEVGQLLGFSAIARELTYRVQVEKQLCQANLDLKIIGECNQALVRDTEESELLHDICRIIVEVGGYRSAWVTYFQSSGDDGSRVALQAGYEKNLGWMSLEGTANSLTQEGSWTAGGGMAMQPTDCIALPLLRQDESGNRQNSPGVKEQEPGREFLGEVPAKDPSCFGALNVCAPSTVAVEAEAVELLVKVANDLAYGIASRRSRRSRLEAEAALRMREQQLRAIFDGALEAMAIADDSGQYLEVNPAACELFGLPKEQLLLRRIADFAEPNFDFGQAWAAFLANGVSRGEFRLCLLDGTVREVEFAASAGFLPNRHLSVLRDITDRKQAEAQLQQYRHHLEELVEERTAELKAANVQLKEEIASRQRVEAALRESSQQLRTLINAMPDLVCFKDGAGRWLSANQAMLQLFELEAIAPLGKTDAQLAQVTDCFWREVLENGSRTDFQAWQQRSEYRHEEMIPKRDGSVKIYDVIKVPLFHTDGERKGLVMLGRDITERKRAQEAAVRLAAIVESSDDAIIGKTLDGAIESWNAGAERIYGYSATEVKGLNISVLAHPERPGEMPQILASIRAGGSIDHYETVHLRKDGKQIDVSLTICPIRDGRGGVAGVSTIARDISDRKRVEAALEQLRHQNELILDSAGDGICGLNRQGKFTFVNPAAARMTGYALRELIDQPLHQSLHHAKPPQSPPCENCQILATLQDGIARRVTDEVFWRKDGTSFPVEYVASPMCDKGEIIGAVVTFKDITERLAIERRSDEFISVVSHELRTPLTSMHAALGLLASGLLDAQPERAKRMLEIAVTNTERLVRLINDILDLEQMKSTPELHAREICNVGDLMLQAADEMRGMAQMGVVNLSVIPLDALVWVTPDRLIQALTNLLSNAIKFSPSGGTVWLTGSCREQTQGCTDTQSGLEETEGGRSDSGSGVFRSGEVLITVRDQGRGIPADKLETIFERFQQVDASDSRQKGGTGLGLAISRSIVQQYGGRIWAESTLGEGSTFFLSLPVNGGGLR